MKAKEYFEKYFENAKTVDEIYENGRHMFRDLFAEFYAIKKTRNPKTVDGLVGIVREINDKWNSVALKVEQKFSTPVIKRNVMWNVILAEMKGFNFPRKPD